MMGWLKKLRYDRTTRKAASLMGVKEITIKENTARIMCETPVFHSVIEEAALIFHREKAVNYVSMEGTARGMRIVVTIRPEQWDKLTPERKAELACSHLANVLRDCPLTSASAAAALWLDAQSPKDEA